DELAQAAAADEDVDDGLAGEGRGLLQLPNDVGQIVATSEFLLTRAEFLALSATTEHLHTRAGDLDAQRLDSRRFRDCLDRVLDDLVALDLDSVRRSATDRFPELLELW